MTRSVLCVSLSSSELVGKFEANIHSSGVRVNVFAEEVLVHLCSQVVVDLVGDGVVHFEICSVLD